MEEGLKNNFFKSVSAYNKERFHSECITWAFNENEELLRLFIKENTDCEEKIEHCRAYSEISQIDILIVYKLHNQNNYKFICIENKVKSEEHFIDLKKSEKCIKSLNKEGKIDEEIYKEFNELNIKLSQTEFYFLRLNEKNNINKIFEKIHFPHLDTSESLHDLLKIDEKNYHEKYYTLHEISNWSFIFLKPGILKIDNKPIEGNTWRSKKIKNPWKNIEYKSLFQTKGPIHKKNDNPIIDQYIKYLKSEFNPSNEENKRFTSDNIKKALSGELNEFEISILKDYFRRLESDFKESDEIKTAFVTDSGNNGGFLFEAYFIKKTPDKIKEFAEDECQNKFADYKLGIQYENSRFKLFFAAKDYDNVKIKDSKKKVKSNNVNEKEYKGLVEEELNKYTDCINFLFENEINKSFNGNRTKTFCSITSKNQIDKSFSNYEEFKNIFSKSLEHIKDVLNKST